MASRKYKARPGTRFSNKDANVIGVELSKMEKAGIARTPRNVLEWARKSANPLHRYFDWDDESAANKHRVEQARELIGVVMEIEVSVGRPARSFHSIVPDDGGRQYQPRRLVKADENWREQVSDRLYASVRASVNEAESLELGSERRWKRLFSAMK